MTGPELALRDRAEFRAAPLRRDESMCDAPDAAFMAGIREALPVEADVDAMLTRKMQRRHRPPPPPSTLSSLTAHLEAFLREHVEGAFTVSDTRWFSGGASKIQMGFTLDWHVPGGDRETTRMVIRMEPAESVNSTSRAREFELLRAMRGVVPVPEVFWVDSEGRWFPEPALIYAFCAGVTKPSVGNAGRLAGIGTAFGPDVRARLAPQFIEHLSRIHTAVPDIAAMPAFTLPPAGGVQSALWQLNRARRIWEEDRGADLPLMEVAANWLERNLPALDTVSVVHGDYRSGNFLFDENSLQITAILDWERAYLGDRHRDLAWTANRAFASLHEDGSTLLASGLLPIDEFLERYERASGLSVDPQRLRYYTVLNSYQLVISALASAARVVHLGKSHQDILLATAEPVGYGACAELRRCLEDCL